MFRVFVLVILMSTQLFAGYDNLGTRLYIKSEFGYNLDNLVFGINSTATNYLDTALDERELPPFPPPEGIHAGFLILDTTQNEIVMSYKDLRPFPERIGDTVRYEIKVLKGAGDIITFSWHPLGNEIASAQILDKITHGTLINVNMKDSTKARIDNEFIEKFELLVVYEPTTDVESRKNNNDLNIYPTEFTDRIVIDGDAKYRTFTIYDILGSKLKAGALNTGYKEINLNDATPGIYIITVFDDKGNHKVKKVIKP